MSLNITSLASKLSTNSLLINIKANNPSSPERTRVSPFASIAIVRAASVFAFAWWRCA